MLLSLTILVSEPKINIRKGFRIIIFTIIRYLRSLHECYFFVAGVFFIINSGDHLHNIIVMSRISRPSYARYRLVIPLSRKPPVSEQKCVRKHAVLFVRIVQFFYTAKHLGIFRSKAGLIILKAPHFKRINLTHYTNNKALVFIVIIFHDSISLSQLFSALEKPPFDRSDRYAELLRNFRYRPPVKIMKPNRLSYLCAQCLDRLVNLRIILANKLLTLHVGEFEIPKRFKAERRYRCTISCVQPSRTVLGDSADPRTEFFTVPQRGQIHPSRYECILRGILSRKGILRYLVGCSHHRALMTGNKLRISGIVA